GGDVLLPAAAGRVAVAAGDVRRWRPDGRRDGRSRSRSRRLRDDPLPEPRPGPARMGGRERLQDARLSARGPPGEAHRSELHAEITGALWSIDLSLPGRTHARFCR